MIGCALHSSRCTAARHPSIPVPNIGLVNCVPDPHPNALPHSVSVILTNLCICLDYNTSWCGLGTEVRSIVLAEMLDWRGTVQTGWPCRIITFATQHGPGYFWLQCVDVGLEQLYLSCRKSLGAAH